MSVPRDKINILCVDSSEEELHTLSETLRSSSLSAEVSWAMNTQEALDLLNNQQGIDCVVTSSNLEKDEVKRFISGMDENELEIPHVLFSSQTLGFDELRSRNKSIEFIERNGDESDYEELINGVRSLLSEKETMQVHTELIEQLFNASIEGIIVCSGNGDIVYYNEPFIDITGIPEENLLRGDSDLVFEYFQNTNETSKKERSTLHRDKREDTGSIHELANGNKVSIRKEPLKKENNELDVWFFRDVTQEIQWEKELLSQRERLESITNNLPVILFALDKEGILQHHQGSALEERGILDQEYVGESVFSVFADNEDVKDACRRAIDGEPIHQVFHVLDSYFEGWLQPTEDESNDLAVIGAAINVDQRIEREENLRAIHSATSEMVLAESKEDVYRVAVKTASDVLDLPAVAFLAPENGVLESKYYTDEVTDLFGEPPSLPIDDSIAGKNYKSGESALINQLRNHEDAYNPDSPIGSEIIVPVSSHGVLISGHREEDAFDELDKEFIETLGANMTAVLERLEWESELKDRERRFHSLLENSSDIVTIIEPDASIKYHSPSIKNVLGLDPEERIGKFGFENVHPDDLDKIADALRHIYQNPEEKFTVEYRVRNDEGEYRHIESILSNHLENPNIEGFVSNSRDITERHRQKKELWKQKEKFREISEVLTHDLKNPLNIAQGQLEIAMTEDDLDRLPKVENALNRMGKLIDELTQRVMTDSSFGSYEEVPLDQCIQKAWKDVSLENAEISTEIDRTVKADSTLLEQVFVNLFRNAAEHAGPNTKIKVGLLDNGFYIEDDGPGINLDNPERIFRRGFTTSNDGTGFGLTLVRRSLLDHGWDIEVKDGEELGGARFEIKGVEFLD